MNYAVFLHPFVVRYLDNLSKSERRKCYRSLKELSHDPRKPRAGCDIKKMSNKEDFYRLRTGGHRFLYVIKENEVFVEEGFKREKGY